jgi:PAS domain S-box-containing protein
VAVALVFALQSLFGAGAVLAFPLYLIVVLLSSIRLGRGLSTAVAALAAIAILARSWLAGSHPVDQTAAVLLAAALMVVVMMVGEITKHAQEQVAGAQGKVTALAASEQRLKSIVGAAAVGLGVAGADGRLTLANATLGAILGRTEEEAQGVSLGAVTAELDRRRLEEALSRLRDGAATHWEGEVTQLRADGSGVSVSIAISRVPGEPSAEPLLLVQENDLSQRRRVDALRDGLVAIQELMVSSQDWEPVMPELLASLCGYLGWEAAFFWTLDAPDGVLRLSQAWRVEGAAFSGLLEQKRMLSISPGEGLAGKVWQSGVVTAQEPPVRAPQPDAVVLGARSAVALPVVDGGAVIGVVELLSRRERELPDDEVALLSTVGIELGQFIRRSVTEQALRRSEADHRAIYERSPIGIARISAEGELLEANPALLQMLEHDLETMQASSWRDLLRAYDQAAARQGRAPLLAGITDGKSVQVRAATGGGRWLWLQLTATSIPDSSGRPEHVLVMVEDVTVVRETSDKLADALESQRSANATLEKLDRTKTEFLSITSHEFRTALTGIQGFSELIRDGGLEADEVRAYGGYIFNDADRVNRLIGDMLDLDRMESGRMAIRAGDVDINAILTEAVARARTASATVDYKTDLDPRMPIVSGDRDRLTQVVSNLVNNAIKYSPDGGRVTLASQIEGKQALVSVSDTGLGIPPDEMGHVFDRFHRVRSGAAQSIPGTGLGLTIVKQIVEMHGGRIWVESAVGHGSSFHFTIPLVQESLTRQQLRHG